MTYFLDEVFPNFRDDLHKGTMIFVPSYFDYVRLRNHFRRERIDFAQICEYTTRANVTRARTYMFKGERPYLMYTERFHYHSRIKVRKIRHIIFYGLPFYPDFYSELSNALDREGDVSVTVIFSKFEAFQLEQIVGTTRARRLLSADKSVHMFT
jgi:U3 small nucleolar RNA-associated protein 25